MEEAGSDKDADENEEEKEVPKGTNKQIQELSE